MKSSGSNSAKARSKASGTTSMGHFRSRSSFSEGVVNKDGFSWGLK